MSRVNGEKARAAIARRNRTNRRVKDRALAAKLAQAAAEKKSAPAPEMTKE